VCIKVDREERPDVDKVYMTIIGFLTELQWSWPSVNYRHYNDMDVTELHMLLCE
jgi:histone acetyltransferase (RNA polymerase elongator complex component)